MAASNVKTKTEQSVTVVAPAATAGQTIAVTLANGDTARVTIPAERRVEVAPLVADALLALKGWLTVEGAGKVDTPPEDAELKKLRGQRDQLAKRKERLGEEITEAEATLTARRGALEEARGAHAHGTASVADVTAARRAVEDAETTLVEAREGLERCAAALSSAQAAYGGRLQAQLRARDQEAAAPLRREAAELLDEFTTAAVAMRKALDDRATLAERVARDYPLADGVPELTLADVAARLQQALGHDDQERDASNPNTAGHWQQALRLILAGTPRPSSPDGVLASFHLTR